MAKLPACLNYVIIQTASSPRTSKNASQMQRPIAKSANSHGSNMQILLIKHLRTIQEVLRLVQMV